MVALCLLIGLRSEYRVEGRSGVTMPRGIVKDIVRVGHKLGLIPRSALITLTVGPGQTYTTIQSAVNAASTGDTIVVQAGSYSAEGTIQVSNKVLTIQGPQVGQSPNTNPTAWATPANLATVGRFNVTGTGGLTIDGLRLVGAAGGGDDDSSIIMLGTGGLSVSNSLISVAATGDKRGTGIDVGYDALNSAINVTGSLFKGFTNQLSAPSNNGWGIYLNYNAAITTRNVQITANVFDMAGDVGTLDGNVTGNPIGLDGYSSSRGTLTIQNNQFNNASPFYAIMAADFGLILTAPTNFSGISNNIFTNSAAQLPQSDTGVFRNRTGFNTTTGSNTVGGVVFDQILTGPDVLASTITGGSGPDYIAGQQLDDTINGGDGNDTILGNSGNDLLTGGVGNDVLIGGTGNDSLTGGAGDDTFNVDAGTDTITDLSGGDILAVTAGATASANVTANYIAGAGTVNNGTATLTTSGFSVNLAAVTTGSGFSVTNNGAATTLTGSSGSDTITGGTGNDTITGRAGTNVLNGGQGDDTFVFSGNFNDYVISCSGSDVVVTSKAGISPANADTISNGEFLQFADKSVYLAGCGVKEFPSITPVVGGLTRSAGSATWGSVIANVADPDTLFSGLTVTATSVTPAGVVTIGNISVSGAGIVTGDIFTSCGATSGTAVVTLQVNDGGATRTSTLNVQVSANTPPTLSYSAATVNQNGSTTIVPVTGPSDNGTVVTVAVQNPGTYTGTVSVSPSGVVSIAAAAPAGTHNITIIVTDNCGSTSNATIALTVNAPPTITAANGVTRQCGSVATSSTIATVNDVNSPVSSLTVTVNGLATATTGGVTVSGIANTAGTVTANVIADCTATVGTASFTLVVSDGAATASTALNVTVTANTGPTLSYNAAAVNAGGTVTINPAGTLTDNGTVSSVTVQNNGGFPGTLNVSNSGVITVSSAPQTGGPFTITIRAVDNCTTATDATVILSINALPTITPATSVTRQVGTATSASTIATVTDANTPVASLTVTVNGGTTVTTGGVTVTGINNNAGTVTANIVASCSATPGTVSFTLEVNDGAATSTATLIVTVTANTAPTLSYAPILVNAGAVTATINPVAAPADNGTVTGISISSNGGFPGGLSVSSAGVVTATNAPLTGGPFTITVQATDNCNTTSNATLTLTLNSLPTITAQTGISRQGGTVSSTATIATVNDVETAAGSLVVTVNGGATASSGGVTISGLQNTAGTVTASVIAECAAIAGTPTFTLQVSDQTGTATATLSVTVTVNTGPTLSYSPSSVNAGGSTTINPNTPISDNGTINTVIVQNSGGFPGTLTVNQTGALAVGGAPATGGPYTITIRASDNCGAFTDAPLTLTVNALPTIVAQSGIARQGGSTSSNLLIATVNDAETPLGSLTVTVNGNTSAVVGGVTISGFLNTAGNITANVVADCGAAAGPASFTLQVSDGAATATASLVVTVTANSAPALGYAAVNVNAGGATTVNPTTALSDNGSVTSVIVQSPGTFTGSVNVSTTGVVSISGAAPSGVHTIIIRAADNCGVNRDATINLTVNALPTITVTSGLSRTAGTTAWGAAVATVSDSETAAASLTVTLTSPNPVNGVTISNIVNTNGAITADIVTGCAVTTGNVSFTFQVSDGTATASTTLSVATSANTAPTLAYTAASVTGGGTTTINPTTSPADNGTITSVTVLSPGTFTGTVTVNTAGVVSVAAAAPAGTHTLTIRATDNCNVNTDVTIALSVNAAPSIVVTTGLSRTGGSTASISTIATVNDADTPAANITVAVNGGASATVNGVTVSGLTNTNGTIAASIVAACAATAGTANFSIQASDGSASSTSTLTVAIVPNSAPTLGYGPVTISPLASVAHNPTIAPADNGSVASIVVASPGTLTGSVTVSSNGIVTISGAYPTGTHTVTIRVADNCGVTTDANIVVTVTPPQSGPGNLPSAAILPSQQKPGSILIFNLYTSSINTALNDTQIALTNTNPVNPVNVHLFFVDGLNCAVSDQFITLTQNQTSSFLASDIDPEVNGYLIAVAVDASGCPMISNFLIGRADVRFVSGHHATLPAIGISGLAMPTQPCTSSSVTATLAFNGVQYDELPRTLSVDSLPSLANGNAPMLIVNRIGGDLNSEAAKLGSVSGRLFDDSEISRSFTLNGGACQLRGLIGDNFPRTQPGYSNVIPAGRTGWMKLWAVGDEGLSGAMINRGVNGFSGGYNLQTLTTTNTVTVTIPVSPVY